MCCPMERRPPLVPRVVIWGTAFHRDIFSGRFDATHWLVFLTSTFQLVQYPGTVNRSLGLGNRTRIFNKTHSFISTLLRTP